MLRVTNMLKLNDSANEQSIVDAITKVQDSLSAALVQNKADKETIANMKKDLDEAADKFKKMEDAYNAAKAQLDTASDAANTLKATNMVTEIAKIGKIVNDKPTIDRWVARAKVDFDGTKAELEALPLNATAAKLPVTEVGKNTPIPAALNASVKMLEIAARHKQ